MCLSKGSCGARGCSLHNRNVECLCNGENSCFRVRNFEMGVLFHSRENRPIIISTHQRWPCIERDGVMKIPLPYKIPFRDYKIDYDKVWDKSEIPYFTRKGEEFYDLWLKPSSMMVKMPKMLCKNFQNGSCTYGKKCRYVHKWTEEIEKKKSLGNYITQKKRPREMTKKIIESKKRDSKKKKKTLLVASLEEIAMWAWRWTRKKKSRKFKA